MKMNIKVVVNIDNDLSDPLEITALREKERFEAECLLDYIYYDFKERGERDSIEDMKAYDGGHEVVLRR